MNPPGPLRLCSLLALLLLFGLLTPPALAQEPAEEAPSAVTEPEEPHFQERFNAWWADKVNGPLNAVLFSPIYSRAVIDEDGAPLLDEEGQTRRSELPLIVAVLLFGGIFFTFRYAFPNFRLFAHAIACVRGKFDRPEDHGEVTHFQALTSALSATVGLGNISGVAIAIATGGAGAVFWMWFTAFFGMTMKFSSCTLAQIYRRIDEDGRVLGGPMVYLHEGLKEVHPALAPVGRGFAIVFAVFLIMAAGGAGNMYQGNQTASIIAYQIFDGSESPFLKLAIGIVMASLAGIVIIGGIRRIGEITSRLVPVMVMFYCGTCLVIIFLNITAVPAMFASIFTEAFNAKAAFGGFLGVLVQGTRRAAFSNEAGLGSAAVAHAAAKTEEPVREGVVALLEPFIDTIVVCTMTALAILITEAHLTPGLEGVEITANAFAQLGGIVPYILCIAVFVFAYSTMISWGYYGERGTEYLFGERGILPYRIVFVAAIAIGPMLSLGAVLDFADILLLSLAFPNIIGMVLLSGKVKRALDDYTRRLRSGEMKPVK